MLTRVRFGAYRHSLFFPSNTVTPERSFGTQSHEAMAVACSTSSRDRRLRFKALLQIPLFPRIAAPALNATRLFSVAGPDISLPEDVLHAVVEDLDPADILALSLTSSHLRTLLIPALYRTVNLRSSRAISSGIRMLARNPNLCLQVRTLTVRPNYYLAWPTPDTPVSEVGVAMDIMSLAQSGSLARLHNFDWDGCEMPPCEELWRVLRKSCPELTEIFANVGARALHPCSELFSFSDLTSFSLSVRHGVADESSLFPDPEPLPPALWTMLLTRCPNLTSLTITSFSPGARLFTLTPLISARFPALTSLTLGSFGYNDNFTVDFLPLVQWRDFLAAHPQLTCLRLAWNFRRWMSPDEDAAFETPLPEALDTFAGVAQQLPGYCLSSLCHPQLASLTCLDLMSEPLYASRAPALCTALRLLPALASFDLWVHVPIGDTDVWDWGALWSACPGVEELGFMCTTTFGKKPLTTLAQSLRRLPRLRAFALTKGHRYVDERMRSSARRVFAAVCGAPSLSSRSDGPGAAINSDSDADAESGRSTRLAQVSVRWARAACRNHLKQEGTYERVAGAKQNANANANAVNGKSETVEVEAWERGLRAVGGAFERRYLCRWRLRVGGA
ncbi:hypothetical protein C8R44DRAFT_806841 [Mycena epipterygia]|nr:hypothetical protein C8R44DRAFT_806841 [Mycena epipterygia]